MHKKLSIFVGVVLVAIALIAVVFGLRSGTKSPSSPDETAVRQTSSPSLTSTASSDTQLATPADRLVSAAQATIQRMPDQPQGYNLLAVAFMQKARETGDFGFNARVEAALTQSFKVAPNNYDAVKLRAKLLLSYHRFGEALDVARRATEQRPQDYEAWGAMTDALVELGRYEDGIKAAQTMVNLRPYTASYARVSYIASLYGDSDGAIKAMRLALESASAGDPESIAWCAVHLGDELLNVGKLKEGEHEYDRALFSFPDYHLALSAKARARLAAGDVTSAVDFYKRSQARVPLPDTAIALGDLYTKLGRADEAKRQYDLVEFTERTGGGAGTYSRQLALFYADHDIKLDEALAIARREREARSDIFTSDALAWCLYKKGSLEEAKTAINEALRLGTRDARINYHAGMIYKSLGDSRAAAKHLQLALQINPSFDVLQADIARQTLRSLAA